ENTVASARTCTKAVADDADLVELQRDIVASYCELGDLARLRGETGLAGTYFLGALHFAEVALQDNSDNPDVRSDAASLYLKLGSVALRLGWRDAARQYFTNAFE